MRTMERKIVYMDAGVMDVSNRECSEVFSDVVDQIECQVQKDFMS